MRLSKKAILPIIVVLITILVVVLIKLNPPGANRQRPSSAAVLSVETQTIKAAPYQIMLDSFGVVAPRTRSSLMSQVNGQIVFVDEAFRNGGFFDKGDLLLAIDDSDFQAEVNIARANLVSAQQNLAEENARVEQARIDWQRLGGDQTPSDLVLRKPQQQSALANLASAEAQLKKAELGLARTQIKAPYSGRIVNQYVDFGAVVSSNTVLADIYATDVLEVRLPINNGDLGFVDLPETKADNTFSTMPVAVTFTSTLIGTQSWTGKVVRTESAIDENSRQLYVVAQIDKPFERQVERGVAIKIGEYVTAAIQGKRLNNALVIPASAIYQGSYVYIEDNGILLRKDIQIAWQNDGNAIVSTGLKDGQALVVTPLGQVSSGTPVSISNRADNDTAPSNSIGSNRPKGQRPNKGNGPRPSSEQGDS